jgi:hypothetical protein
MKKSILPFMAAILALVLSGSWKYSSSSKQISRGDIKFILNENGFRITRVSSGQTLLESYNLGSDQPIGFASYPQSTVNYEKNIHSVIVDGPVASQWWTNKLVSSTVDEKKFTIDAVYQNTANGESFNIHVQIVADNRVKVEIKKSAQVAKPWNYRTRLRLKLFPDEYFMGFGERLEGIAFRGKKMLNWISEGQADAVPSPNPENQGNYRVPFYLSTRGYGLLLNENSCSSFDLGATDSNVNEVVVWDQQLSFTVYTGANPNEIIKNYTEDAGRILRLPEPWVFGVWMMAKNREWNKTETDKSRLVAKNLRKDTIPCSVIWHHYWSEKITNILGSNQKWDLDKKLYPDYANLVNEHHRDGFKVLHYYWPYIFFKDYDFKEAEKNAIFMRNAKGETCSNPWLSGWLKVAEPDLTKQSARTWYGNNILINAFNAGSSGWMTDFGEHHRIDMVDSANGNPYALHNTYPLYWGKTNQEFWEAHQPDGDYTYWMRGGWTGIQKYSPLMWIGDPQFDWSARDGIKTIIPAILSAGVSGHPLVSSHIAGYEYNTQPANKEELWIRWLEACALFPVMWTHEGSELYFKEKLTYEYSEKTKSLFKKYSRLHVQFFPYIYTLAKEGKETGVPVTRPLYFEYPEDPATILIKDQFMLGDRVMVAPILDSGATKRTVYFPEGNWYSFWTGALVVKGPATISIGAQLEELPIFVSEGAILPLYNQTAIQTLVKNVDGANDFEYANSSMELRFYGCGKDQFKLWDNTLISMHHFKNDAAQNVQGGPSRTYVNSYIQAANTDCYEKYPKGQK